MKNSEIVSVEEVFIANDGSGYFRLLDLETVRCRGKYGCIVLDQPDDIVLMEIPCLFDEIEVFLVSNNGMLFFVKQDGKLGLLAVYFVDEQPILKALLPCRYDEIEIGADSESTVTVLVVQSGKKGIYLWTPRGEGVLKCEIPCEYDEILPQEYKGRNVLYITKGDNRYYYGLDGEKLTPCKENEN